MIENQKLAGNGFGRIARGLAILSLAGAVPALFTPSARAADAGYIRVIPAQGATLDGGSKDAGHMKWITVSSVVAADLDGDAKADRESSAPAVSEVAPTATASRVTAPRDVATGMASGKRMHKPFTITKEVDSASPLLAKACASGQHFSEVDVDLASGHYKLTDVVIASDTKSNGGAAPTETISFTYQKIEMSR